MFIHSVSSQLKHLDGAEDPTEQTSIHSAPQTFPAATAVSQSMLESEVLLFLPVFVHPSQPLFPFVQLAEEPTDPEEQSPQSDTAVQDFLQTEG